MIFLDNASTTKMFDDSFEIMKEYSLINYFNPSAVYGKGVFVHKRLEEARETVAGLIGCSSENIIFTSSATESTNLAILGSIKSTTKHIVTSEIEHPATYNTFLNLKEKGINVSYLSTNADGTINIESVKEVVTNKTDIISIMQVNNETGAVNDVKKIVAIAKKINPKIIAICDGVQAFGKIPVNVISLGVDFYVISSHKVHGPKGVGALYVKNLNALKPQLIGGGQERGFRSSTENVAGILAFANSAKRKVGNLLADYEFVKSLKEICISKLSKCSLISFNSPETSSPYILSFSAKNLKAEVLLHMLEEFDICVGNGSACSSHHKDNRVLRSMGVKTENIIGTIRLSFSCFNTREEIEFACDKIIECVNKLNNIIGNK